MKLIKVYLLFVTSVLLTACGGGGGSGSPSADTQPPDVPQNLAAVASSTTQVSLSWSAANDNGGGTVSGYKLYRDGAFLVTVASGTSYTDTGLSANTTYSYRVLAFDNASPANESAQSPAVSVTTPASPPPGDTSPPTVPQNLTASALSENQVSLNWSASSDVGGGSVAGYRIYRDSALIASVTTGTAYTDNGLSPSTTYSYRVSAFDDATPANESAQSSPAVSVTTPDTSAPSVPQGVSAAAVSETQVDLNWNASTDAGGGSVAGYKVYRDGTLLTLVSATGYSDTSVSGNTTYSYTVSAYDSAVPPNESAQSSPAVSVTTPDMSAPTVPTGLSGTPVGETQVDLSWNASTDNGGGNVAGYRVFRGGSLIATVATTSYSDTGLSANTSYSYTVLAFDDAATPNESAQSSPPVSVTTGDTTPPSVPQNVTATAISHQQVRLGWTASTDNGGSVAGYKIFRDGALVTQVSSNRYSDSGLTANTTYSYTVSAVDGSGNESAQSSPSATITTPTDPGLPQSYNFSTADVSAWTTVDNTTIASNWSASAGKYHQTVDVADQDLGNPFDQSYKLGTYSYLAGLTSATGYRLSVDITPIRDAPPRDVFDGQDVGVMFRYQNNNNYYRLSFSARESYTRLEKKVGGVFTTLAVNSRGYVEQQTFNVQVNLSGKLIQVKVNGDPVFAVSDGDLSSGSIALYAQDAADFDNVQITQSDTAATMVAAKPLAYSVLTGNAVTASAAATNLPDGGSVDFSFGGASCAAAAETAPGSGFFTADCGTPAQGDYFLAGQGLVVNLRNSAGGVVASDENTRVGIQGDNYITVGDSITLGTFDLYSGDNSSQDGRIIGQQGYQARLADLLDAATPYPNILFNEGVGGDKTTDTIGRINSILERHPDANKVLLLLGTNDSGGATPLSGTAYQNNMQSIVNSVTAQGKSVWVAKVPPVLPRADNLTRNNLIEDYNTRIDSLSNTLPGPDLYSFFYDDNNTVSTSDDKDRVSLFNGKLHPNALGNHIMADLWNNALTGSTAAPFFLDRLCNHQVSASCNIPAPTNHKQNLLEVGNEVYIDATYKLQSVPAAVAGGIWIQTANAEFNVTSSPYIDFNVDRPVTVYIAYDAGAATLPTWLDPAFSGYADTGLTLQTDDPSSPNYRLYSQSFSAGAISLGANLATGASGADRNYLVIVVAQ